MSSLSKSETKDAWMAAPRAAREDGSIAVGSVEGDIMRVDCGKKDCRRVEILGVCDVPPERIT